MDIMTPQMDGIIDGKRPDYIHLSTPDDYPDYLFNYNSYTKTYVVGNYLKVIDRAVVMDPQLTVL